jgi:hypothetical protein
MNTTCSQYSYMHTRHTRVHMRRVTPVSMSHATNKRILVSSRSGMRALQQIYL